MASEKNLDTPTVIKMEGWSRHMRFDETGFPWVPTSPSAPNLDMATLYPGTCLLEGTNVSEGRGTSTPFQVLGAPWIDATKPVSYTHLDVYKRQRQRTVRLLEHHLALTKEKTPIRQPKTN